MLSPSMVSNLGHLCFFIRFMSIFGTTYDGFSCFFLQNAMFLGKTKQIFQNIRPEQTTLAS